MASLDWRGFLLKKAFKTATKNSWKRRFFVFDSSTLTLKYFASEAPGQKEKGIFVLDASEPVIVDATNDHGKPNELKIMSNGQIMYAAADTMEAARDLLQRIDLARRAKIVGDDGQVLVKLEDGDKALAASIFPGEPGTKAFTWGVGSMLGIGNSNVQGMALPQRVQALRAPVTPTTLSSGPEHAAALTAEGQVVVWGSNEFSQLAQPVDFTVAFRPTPLSSLASRIVLSIACGGSHTLAVVADAGASPAGGSASAQGGVLMGWGTGTVGQLGLGDTAQLAEVPTLISLPPTATTGGKPVPVSQVFAGLVTSAATTLAGEAFVWGDASIGRLGLSSIVDSSPQNAPVLVNAAKVWTPTHVPFTAADLGTASSSSAAGGGSGGSPIVVSIALGGSFSIFLLHSGAVGAGPGCTMLVSGGLGIDITKDAYPVAGTVPPAEFDAAMDREISGIERSAVPRPVAPFGNRSVVLGAWAGARHAAVIASSEMAGGAPRLFTAGKGWLGHARDDAGGAAGVLLQPPRVSQAFAPVAGVLENEDVVEASCGHSHTVARTSDGKLFSWGRGDSGELGAGNLTDSAMPRLARSLDGHVWKQVAAGSYYTAALAEPGFGARKPVGEILGAFEARTSALSAGCAAVLGAVLGGVSGAKKGAKGGEAAATSAPTAAATAAAEPADAAAADSNELPAGWDYEYDDDGNIYFIRPDGSTQWDDPRD